MRRVLMVSPHFPPDATAASHRVLLLAPHLPRYGWEPTVVTVDPRDYEGRLDPELAELVPTGLRVVRCRAWSAQWTRRFGVGDLGLRAFSGLLRTCSHLLGGERFDALFITIYPTYPALLGPLLKRRFGVPFVLDYQDPWVGSWGLTVGGGRNGAADWKSRLTRAVARRLEPVVTHAADAITAVSVGTYEEIRARDDALGDKLWDAIPLGGEPADIEYLRAHPRPNRCFDWSDGRVHVCYVGTLLPAGIETLRAVLQAVALLRNRRPELYRRLRFHFVGTSNQSAADAPQRVLPVAREMGVSDCVTEVASRIPYLDALTVQCQASVILMMGSSEPHYTASKLYPALLAKRPLLAVYHEASSVVAALGRIVRPAVARVVTYNDTQRAAAQVEAIYGALSSLAENPTYDASAVDLGAMTDWSAQRLAGKLAAILDCVSAQS